jgi:hypothetical protein
MKALVFKPTNPVAFGIFGMMDRADSIRTATLDLAHGYYALTLTCPPILDTAESVFDHVNTETTYSMNPGDVIVWSNGKRELCLSHGWASI